MLVVPMKSMIASLINTNNAEVLCKHRLIEIKDNWDVFLTQNL